MSIENNLKGIINTCPKDYYLEDTDEICNDDVSMFTDDIVDASDIELAHVPQKIVLSCSVEATKIETPVCVRAGKPIYIYIKEGAEAVAYESVSIKYADFGKIVFADGEIKDLFGNKTQDYTLNINDILYKHEFMYQTKEVLYQSIPNQINLMAYGGRYVYGKDISQIQQTFFHVKNANTDARIIVSDKFFWNERGIDPHIGGMYHTSSDIKIVANHNRLANTEYNLAEIYTKAMYVFNSNHQPEKILYSFRLITNRKSVQTD